MAIIKKKKSRPDYWLGKSRELMTRLGMFKKIQNNRNNPRS